MKKQCYKIPKNLCQKCYEVGGRYILDCYCIVCDECYSTLPINKCECKLCGKPTKGHKIDATHPGSIKKIQHFFENVESGLQKIKNNYQFQTQIANRYCQHLQKQLKQYQQAVNQLISCNPNLYQYFDSRVKLNKIAESQPYHSRNNSVKGSTTVKPYHEYNSEIQSSKRTEDMLMSREDRLMSREDMPGIRKIANHSKEQYSGRAVYKVPNLNMNTALRSSMRSTRDRLHPEEYEYMQNYRRQ